MPPVALADILPLQGDIVHGTTKSPSNGAPTLISSSKTPSTKVSPSTISPLAALCHGDHILPGIPTFPTYTAHRTHIKQHLAGAFRHWFREGFVEGMSGHISVRDPEYHHAFWTNPIGLHWGLIKSSDMILVRMDDGSVLDPGQSGKPVNQAGFLIHKAVHEARSDVHAVCHAHTVHGKAWSVFGRPLEMLTQDACKFYKAHSVYNNHGGVVLGEEEGRRIAEALGPTDKALLLRNHGLLTTGTTVDEAAWLFLSMEHACQGQLLAEAAAANGLKKVLIGDEEARFNFEAESDPEVFYNEFQGYFDYEVAMAEREGGFGFRE